MVLQKLHLPSKISLVNQPPTREIHSVNIVKNLLFSSAFIAGAGLVHGQNTVTFEFTADSKANYRQGQTRFLSFEGATFDMDIRDGVFLYAPSGCEDTVYFPPGGGCPIGATGFVTRGLDNDPLLNGKGPYFSVTNISPAAYIRPFEPNAVRLYSAPPSLLPRPLGGFSDLSLNVFYNLTTPYIRQYNVTRYDFSRQYAASERSRFDGEIVPGTYIYNFPSLNSTATPVVIAINQYAKLDGYREINSQRQGFRFLNLTYDDGFAVLNPYELNFLKWEGNTNSFITPTFDNLFLSIKPLANPLDPLSDPVQFDGMDPATLPVFPNFVGSGVNRILLPSPLDTSYIMPPNFVAPGETGVIDMEFTVYRPTNGVVYENSIRRFRLPVKFTDPYASAIIAALPATATSAQRAADFDYDGDGVSNFTEWVFKSNPALKGSVPVSPSVSSSAPSASLAKAEGKTVATQSSLEYKVAKLTNSVPKLKYTIEYSKDMKTWQGVVAGDPLWTVLETQNEIKVTGSATNTASGGFFRAKVQAL